MNSCRIWYSCYFLFMMPVFNLLTIMPRRWYLVQQESICGLAVRTIAEPRIIDNSRTNIPIDTNWLIQVELDLGGGWWTRHRGAGGLDAGRLIYWAARPSIVARNNAHISSCDKISVLFINSGLHIICHHIWGLYHPNPIIFLEFTNRSMY